MRILAALCAGILASVGAAAADGSAATPDKAAIQALEDNPSWEAFKKNCEELFAGFPGPRVARTTDVYRKMQGKRFIVAEHNSVPVDLQTMKPDILSKP
jgi:hypothetical protein